MAPVRPRRSARLCPPNAWIAATVIHAAILGSLAMPSDANAQAVQAGAAQARDYAIPAGALGDLLALFSATAGVQLVFDPAPLAGKTSAGLNGRYTLREGFAQLLRGSGQQLVDKGNGTYALQTAPASAQAGGVTSLAAVTVMAQADSGATTENTGSYTTHAATIGRTGMSLRETPQSVSVVTRQRMDDQALTSLSAVLDNVPGFTTLQTPAGGKSFASRGFSLNNVQYDGVPLARQRYSSASNFDPNTAFVDRVEVLRGAQGLLEGAGSPGGAINLVRKRGTAEPMFNVDARAGSWNQFGGQLDGSGPLNKEGTLRGRALIDYDTQHSFIDVKKSRTYNLYGALDYDVSPDTTIGLGISVAKVRATPSFWGVPRYSNRQDLGLSRSTFLGASWNRWDQDETTLYADLEHRFNADWKLKVSAIHVQEDNYQKYMVAFGAVNPVTGLGPRGMTYDMDHRSRHTGFDANLQGRFEAAGFKHNVTLGANASQLKSSTQQSLLSNVPSINVFNPNPYVIEPTSAQMAANGVSPSAYDPVLQKGVYGVLRTQLTEPLTLVMGGRFSWYEYVYRSGANLSTSTSSKEDAKFTPYGGLVYALSPQWSVYGSYTDIFNPQAVRTADGRILDPEIGANYEAGIKGELLDGRLNASFAVFNLKQKNRAVTDYDSGMVCDGDYCSRAAGKVRSQGFETEISGELLPNWKLFAGYTLQNLKYVSDAVNEGKRFNPEIPKHIFRLWSDYTLPGDWNRLSVGGGVNVQSATLSSAYNQGQGGYSIWNARIGYRINSQWSAALNVNNVFDKTYYSRILDANTYGNYYGTPRSVLLSLHGRF